MGTRAYRRKAQYDTAWQGLILLASLQSQCYYYDSLHKYTAQELIGKFSGIEGCINERTEREKMINTSDKEHSQYHPSLLLTQLNSSGFRNGIRWLYLPLLRHSLLRGGVRVQKRYGTVLCCTVLYCTPIKCVEYQRWIVEVMQLDTVFHHTLCIPPHTHCVPPHTHCMHHTLIAHSPPNVLLSCLFDLSISSLLYPALLSSWLSLLLIFPLL